MKINKLQFYSLFGILGSLLMFSGDMILYYEPVSGLDYNSVAVMSNMPVERLIAGGIIGPIASVFSIIGGYIFYLLFKSINKVLAKILFISFAILFIFGGTYHAVFANYGIIGRLPEPLRSEHLLLFRTYLKSIYFAIFISGTIGTLILFYLVFFKKSLFPIWMLLFTPTLLTLLSQFVKNSIPYPLGAIVYGGWINLSFVLFFTICFFYFTNKEIEKNHLYFHLKH